MTSEQSRNRIAQDATAQRLLNLAFIFNTSTRPISTSEIIADSDLGYGSDQRSSDLRKFNRDRQKLAEQGIEIVSCEPSISAENEETFWRLDRENTFAAGGVITADDADVLLEAIDEYLSGPPSPLRVPLMNVRTKVLELTGDIEAPQAERPLSKAEGSQQAMLNAVWLSFSLRRELTFSYTNAQGERSRRVVAIYGIFSHEGSTYIVGLDDKSGSLRTFRVDRMDRALRPGNPYTIPADFDIRDFLFLSFDFGAQDAATASFTFPAEQTEGVIAAITHDRGALSRGDDGTWMWTVEVRSLDGAASFALEHAHDGMRPAAPQELVDRWCAAIDKVVNAHVAR